ncbi:sigma-70 family RNA polymerase sigma factor [Synergistaceae bacterium OttesenSCG-928-I11]|nr:sigma-70 family RNA polymerase sigma factor [Synergistaceae bacterium OttesenSCG-928-I11]
MKGEQSTASLDPAVESALWSAVDDGSEEARERLILAYRPMVFWLAKKFRVPYNAYPDLIQEGMIGLIAAVDNFETARNNRFITYAYYKVRGRMANFLQRSESKAPLPVEEEYLERPDSFEDDLDRMEWHLAIQEGMETLPRKEMEVVRSLVLEGRKAADIAFEQGVGVSHIYRLQRRALARLKGWFAKEDATSEA